MRKQLRIGAFFDGRPGHEKQTRGILRVLERLATVDVSEILIKRQPLGREIGKWIKYLFGARVRSGEGKSPYDLLIGTGSHTHLPMLFCKKKWGLPVVTCMSPPSIVRNHFDLCCVPQHDGLKTGENIFQTVGPPNCSLAKGEQQANKGLILLGGVDPRSHHWRTDDLKKHLEELLREATVHNWTITSSPRTPEKTCLMVDQLIENRKNIAFFRFEETKSGWIEQQYESNKTVWVTADSMSMVYEALTAGCHVGIVPVEWKKKKSKFRRSEEFLVREGYVLAFDARKRGFTDWPSRGPLDEATRCAEEIVKRWC